MKGCYSVFSGDAAFQADHFTCKEHVRNMFRNNIDEELTVVRKTERDKETYKFVCFSAWVLTPAALIQSVWNMKLIGCCRGVKSNILRALYLHKL